MDVFTAPIGAKILSIAARATTGEKIIWGMLNLHGDKIRHFCVEIKLSVQFVQDIRNQKSATPFKTVLADC